MMAVATMRTLAIANRARRCCAAGLGSGLCDWRKPAPSEAISPKHSPSHVLKLEGSAVRLPVKSLRNYHRAATAGLIFVGPAHAAHFLVCRRSAANSSGCSGHGRQGRRVVQSSFRGRRRSCSRGGCAPQSHRPYAIRGKLPCLRQSVLGEGAPSRRDLRGWPRPSAGSRVTRCRD